MIVAGSPMGPRAFAARLAELAGWRRAAVLAVLGAIATLALPPVQFVPLLWLSFTGLVLILDGAKSRRGAFFDGFWFAFAHYSASFYWIAYALLIDVARFGWMIPFAVLGLGALIALFAALATLLAREIAPPGAARVLALAAAWGFGEWLRVWVLTGFPWNLTGTVWVGTPVAQFASVAGVLGVSVITVGVAAMPAAWVRSSRGAIPTIASLVVLALIALWGWLRLPDGPVATVPNVKLRLVQASVPEKDKWSPANRTQELVDQIELTRGPGFDSITDAIWPETAAPYFLDEDMGARQAVASAAPKDGLVITGAPRETPPDVKPYHIWNSLDAVNGAGAIVATYDKAHLVPFGEYTPFPKLLYFAKVTEGAIGFSSGPGPRTLTLAGLPPVSPLICYEAIFPGAVVDRDHRPSWLLNITNDGWFGLSAGPYQHFAAARMRAIEEGLPLVRDGNTGITAFVDPYGRVIASLPLGARGVLDGALPKPLGSLTLFARLGNISSLILVAVVAVAAWVWGRRAGV